MPSKWSNRSGASDVADAPISCMLQHAAANTTCRQRSPTAAPLAQLLTGPAVC